METNTHPDIIYKVSASELKLAIDDTLNDIIKASFLAPYEFRTVGTLSACEILGISLSTIHRHIKAKKLKPLENEGRNFRFTLKQLLEFNMSQMNTPTR